MLMVHKPQKVHPLTNRSRLPAKATEAMRRGFMIKAGSRCGRGIRRLGYGQEPGTDKERTTMAMAAAMVVLSWQTAVASQVVILVAAVVGWRMFLSAWDST